MYPIPPITSVRPGPLSCSSLANLADIGLLLITDEEAIASGVRRIEAVAGMQALAKARDIHDLLAQAKALLSAQAKPQEFDARLQPIVSNIESYLETKTLVQNAGKKPEPLDLPDVRTEPLEPFDAQKLHECTPISRSLTLKKYSLPLV